jgi:hypothetical protein
MSVASQRTVLNSHAAGEPVASVAAAARSHATAAAPWIALVVACALAVTLAAPGLGDDGRTGAGHDSSRYAMNAVYFADVLRDRPFGSPAELVEYTRYYFARYPALSLGHHPVLLPAVAAPAVLVAGISLSTLRGVVIAFFVMMVAFTWALVRRTHGAWAAAAAALLVATNPYLLRLGQTVLSEIPAAALVVASAFFLHRFCDRQRRRDLACFTVSAALAVYAKQLSGFVFPGFLLYASLTLGWRRLLRRDVMIAAAVFLALVAPLVPMTVMLAKANVGYLRVQVPGHSAHHSAGWLPGRSAAVQAALRSQFTSPVLAAIAVALMAAVASRDRRSLLYVAWFVSVLACVVAVTGTIEPVRFSMYWIPALLALAGTVAMSVRRGVAAGLIAVLAGLALAHQGWVGAHTSPETTRGYEAAAQVVLQQPPAATVMFSGEIDSGLFVFFVRKHDPSRRQIVLRADKVLATSFMASASVEDRIAAPEEIYDVLRYYGTRYVVVEDRPTQARVLQWVRQAVHTDRFRQLYHAPLVSDDPRLRNASIGVYELRDARAPDPGAVLDIKLALIGQQLDIPLRELIARRYLH